jgi:hypothetical protein
MRSVAAAIWGKTRKFDRLDAAVEMSIDAESRHSGAVIEPRATTSLDEVERLHGERSLEDLERLLREHSLRSARGSMDIQEYLEFVAILEDTRTRIETVLDELPVSGAIKARLKRVAADLERAGQAYRDKFDASRSY